MTPRYLVFLLFTIFVAGCLTAGDGGPSPHPNASYSQAELKYLLLDHYGEDRFFYCDPDYYPVGHGDELERAVATFPLIQNETAVFSAITARKGLHAPYSDDAKLVIYREYKKLRAILLDPAGDGTYTFSLQLGNEGEGRRVSGMIRSDGIVLEERSETAFLTCPICLSGDTRIDTPLGPVRVKNIPVGMFVWTLDADGVRRAVPVLQIAKTQVPSHHHVIHLQLSDGRELSASPGHPMMDGRLLGTLTRGDGIDGASVIRADPVPYPEEFTFDILPGGDTGAYWANGIPLKSTLFQK